MQIPTGLLRMEISFGECEVERGCRLGIMNGICQRASGQLRSSKSSLPRSSDPCIAVPPSSDPGDSLDSASLIYKVCGSLLVSFSREMFRWLMTWSSQSVSGGFSGEHY